MLKKVACVVFSWLQRTVNAPEFQEDNIHVAWADFEEKGKPYIVVYSVDTCNVCREVELFLANNWIPNKEIKCKLMIPIKAPKMRSLIGIVGFKTKHKKRIETVFLHQNFPQVDLVEPDGSWTRHIGNAKNIRTAVEDFIVKHAAHYPGFEAGVYGDKPPAEQAAQQMGNIFGKGRRQ